jgi:hypothetical protein
MPPKTAPNMSSDLINPGIAREYVLFSSSGTLSFKIRWVQAQRNMTFLMVRIATMKD